MPVKTVRIRTSSISDKEIPEGKGARVRIVLNDKSCTYRADLTDAEFKALVKELNAEKVEPREKKVDEVIDDEAEVAEGDEVEEIAEAA